MDCNFWAIFSNFLCQLVILIISKYRRKMALNRPILVEKSKLTLFDVEYKLDGMNVVPVDKNTGVPLDEKQLDLLRKQLMKEWRYVDEDEEE